MVTPVTLDRASVRRQGRTIVDGVSARLGAARTTVILGPNGAGKSTLLRLLAGMVRASDGEVTWASPWPELRQCSAFVFQTPALLRRSVLDNIAYPLHLRGVARTEARTQAATQAERAGLDVTLSMPADRLSGGERQRMAVARALVTRPKVLFLDEPTASLDGRSTREIEALLLAARDEGTQLFLVTHDLGQARRFADEIVFLHEGRLLEQADAATFFAGPADARAAGFLKGDIVE
ncbi:ATP-binding cassette domain-containing protein [Rhizobiaceae bacterium]|nr:ATP-binding cassette domain-containing protein [Rhizobiaceae bacterium]